MDDKMTCERCGAECYEDADFSPHCPQCEDERNKIQAWIITALLIFGGFIIYLMWKLL